MIRKLTFLGAALAGAALVMPAQAAPRTDVQFWPALQITGKLDKHVFVTADVIMRTSDNTGDVNQIETLAGIGFRFNKSLAIVAGGGRLLNRTASGRDFGEIRFFTQAQLGFGNIAGGTASGRLRLERRRIDTGADTSFRLRAQLRYAHPLAPKSATSFVAYHESFITLNDTDWGPPSGWRQMRNFAGLRQAVTPQLSVEGGYLNQYTRQRTGPATIDHIAAVTLAVAL